MQRFKNDDILWNATQFQPIALITKACLYGS